MKDLYDNFIKQLQHDLFSRAKKTGIPYDEAHDDLAPILNFYGKEIYSKGATHPVAIMLKNKYGINFDEYNFGLGESFDTVKEEENNDDRR